MGGVHLQKDPHSLSAACVSSLALHGKRINLPRTGKGATLSATGYKASNGSSNLENILSNPLLGLDITARYATNITVNGQNFLVAIDTGSSDLWISPSSNFRSTSTQVQSAVNYATSVVSGTVSTASVAMGSYSFDSQALIISRQDQVGLTGILDLGMDGLIGLAFDGGESFIETSLKTAGFPTSGQPFLFNIFDQTPDASNFIAVSLSRTDDLEDSADASFLINELDETYAAVAQSTPIPIFPNQRWNLVVDSITVDGKVVATPASTVTDNKSGNLVALMDTGTPSAFVPPEVFNGIYGNIPGALFSAQTGSFIIPCNTTTIVTVVFGGQSFPIHPLDLSDVKTIDEVTVCVSSFFAGAGNTDFDMLFGDSIMRNMYSVFNFGSAIAKSPGPASNMQLLSQTDPVAAAADVISVRMAQLAKGPPEGAPTSFGPLTSIPPPAFAAAVAASSSDNATGGDEESVRKYAPVVIGLLGANLVLMLGLVVFAAVTCVRRGGRAASVGQGKYVPVRFKE
ncbi:aspartic peptidase domain-containing protein [Mycena albidolilacea]|uniref:Aspartic peptidase domain-containing protein n=1 Tax=Mycena albidolilacea TaxID=1033008 RepID=A0AAD6ZAS9_9AGAR|nr:aspartic peptidase domain-containing protein [Mycena albidolilacea]